MATDGTCSYVCREREMFLLNEFPLRTTTGSVERVGYVDMSGGKEGGGVSGSGMVRL